MEVGHIAPVFESENPTHGGRRGWNFIPSQRVHHAADQVHHQIAGNARTISSPATPPREVQRVERNLRSIVQPCVPIERLWREIGWRRIFPRSSRIVATQRKLNHLNIADRAAGIKFASLFAE